MSNHAIRKMPLFRCRRRCRRDSHTIAFALFAASLQNPHPDNRNGFHCEHFRMFTGHKQNTNESWIPFSGNSWRFSEEKKTKKNENKTKRKQNKQLDLYTNIYLIHFHSHFQMCFVKRKSKDSATTSSAATSKAKLANSSGDATPISFEKLPRGRLSRSTTRRFLDIHNKTLSKIKLL